MELLILYDPILRDSRILIVFLIIQGLLFLETKLNNLALDILILDLYHIFLVLVDHTQQLTLDLYKMLRGIGLAEIEHLLLENEVWIKWRISISSTFFFFIVEFQWFLMELSVLPGSIFVISAHLLPWAVWARNSTHSSCGIHSIFRILGLRWLCQRSRHCFPKRPSTNLAMKDQRCGPYFSTNLRTKLSSCSVQGFFLRKRERLLSDYMLESLLSSSTGSSS